MDGSAGGLSAGEQSLDHLVVALCVLGQDLRSPVSGNTAHVVMYGGQDWDWLLGGINTSENVGSLKNSGETLVDGLWGQVVQVQVAVIAFGANTTSLEDFHGHGAG